MVWLTVGLIFRQKILCLKFIIVHPKLSTCLDINFLALVNLELIEPHTIGHFDGQSIFFLVKVFFYNFSGKKQLDKKGHQKVAKSGLSEKDNLIPSSTSSSITLSS